MFKICSLHLKSRVIFLCLFFCACNGLCSISLLFLIKPYWYFVNKALADMSGLPLNWITVIILLSALLFFIAVLFMRTIARDCSAQKSAVIAAPAVLVVTLIIDVFIIGVLFGMGGDISIISRNLKSVLPYIGFILFSLFAVFVFPHVLSKSKKKLLTGCAVFCLTCAALFVYHGDCSAPRITSGPYLEPVANGMAVCWITDRESTGRVEFKNGTTDMTAVESSDGIITTGTVHRVILNGLTAGAVYSYKAVSRPLKNHYAYHSDYFAEISSTTRSFKMPDLSAKEVSFVVLNDVHEQKGVILRLLSLSQTAGSNFVVFNGDTFNYMYSQQQVEDVFMRPVTAALSGQKPVLFIRGNHETRGAFADKLKRYTGSNGYYYSYNDGPLHVIVLDAGEDKADGHEEYSGLADFDNYRMIQTAWLKRDIESTSYQKAVFRVVIMHIPLFNENSSERSHGADHAANLWKKMLDDGRIDLLIAGHTHKYGIINPAAAHAYPIVIGGGEGDFGNTVITVNVHDRTMDVSILDERGNVLKSCTIRK